MESMGFGKKMRQWVTLASVGLAAAGASDKATDEDVRNALNPGVNAPVATEVFNADKAIDDATERLPAEMEQIDPGVVPSSPLDIEPTEKDLEQPPVNPLEDIRVPKSRDRYQI